MRTKLLTNLLLLLIASYSYASDINFSDPYSILNSIEKHGASYVVSKEINNWETWDKILKNIESCKKIWIEVAIAIKPGTDAGYSETLSDTLAFALPNAPENILPIIGDDFKIQDVCGFPFIEPTDTFLKEHHKKSLKALARVYDPKLEKRKNACIKTLNQQFNALFKINRSHNQ